MKLSSLGEKNEFKREGVRVGWVRVERRGKNWTERKEHKKKQKAKERDLLEKKKQYRIDF